MSRYFEKGPQQRVRLLVALCVLGTFLVASVALAWLDIPPPGGVLLAPGLDGTP